MSETITQNRDKLNEYLATYAEDALLDLHKTQAKVAAKLQAGEELTWDTLNKLAERQATRRIWAAVARTREFWEQNEGRAPERTDLVEAVHTQRNEVLREVLSYRGQCSTDPMSNALEQVAHQARRSFLDLTRGIYPKGSVLRDLGR